jgi:S-adenosylmethionine:tRNA-ribosyltransferase-isomerase (queuine synthetase)
MRRDAEEFQCFQRVAVLVACFVGVAAPTAGQHFAQHVLMVRLLLFGAHLAVIGMMVGGNAASGAQASSSQQDRKGFHGGSSIMKSGLYVMAVKFS